MRISVLRPLPRPDTWSMEICADQTIAYLKQKFREGDSVSEYRPTYFSSSRGGIFHFQKYIQYQCLAARHQADINHIMDHSYGHLVLSLDHRRTIVTLHDMVLMKVMSGSLPVRFDAWWRILSQRYSLMGIQKARKVIAVSNASKQDFLQYAQHYDERDVEVIPLGVDTLTFKRLGDGEVRGIRARYGLDQDKRYVLHVGQNAFYKNIEGVLNVLSRLDQRFHLLKIGSDFSPSQKRIILQKSLDSRIHLIQNAPRSDLPGLFNAACVLLYPSLHEGFGLPPLEAMACGVPVVCSDIPVFREILADAAMFFPWRDEASMARAIENMVGDETLKEAFVQRGLRRSSVFTWESTADKIYRLYETVHAENT